MKGIWFDLTTRVLGMDEATTKIVGESEEAGKKAGDLWSRAFGKGVDESGASVTAMEKQLSTMEGQVKSYTATLQSESRKSVAAFDVQADAAGRLRIAEQRLADLRNKNVDEDSVRWVKAEESLATAKRNVARASGEAVAQAESEMAAYDKLMAKQAEVAAKQDEMAATQSKGAGGMGLLGMGAGGVALIGVGAAAITADESMKKAGDFQQSTQKLVDTAGLGEKSLAGVSQGLLQLSTQTGYSAKDLADGAYIVSSGMTAQAHATNEVTNTLDLMRAGTQLAAEENSDLHGTLDAITTTVKDYGSAAGSATQVASEMNAALSHGKMTLDQFSPALGQVQASAAAAHVPVTDLYATLAQANSHGLPVEQAAQNANHAISALQAPSEKMTAMLAAVGIDSTQLADDLGTKGLSGTMEMIHEAIEQHIGPSGKMMVDVFSHSKVATEDAAAAYDKLPPKLKAIADQVKAGTLKVSLGALEGQGLDLASANQVEEFAARWKKATGFSSLLTGGKNLDLTSQQAMNMAMGTMDASRLAGFVTGKDNQADIQATLHDETANATESKRTGQVVGFAKSQETYNARLRDTKAEFGRLEIEIGEKLLPYGEKFLKWVQKGTDFLERHHVVIGKVTNAVLHFAGDALKYFIDSMEKLVDGGKAMWHGLHIGVVDPLIKAGHGVGDAFKAGKEVAIEAFKDLEKGLGTPAYAIMRYIYQDGIRSMWDGASDLVGGALGHLPDLSGDISNIPHFAQGGIFSGPGIVPGCDTGVDNTNAYLRRGEGVAVPEFVQWFGEDNWHAANRYFSGRGGAGDGFHYDIGGIFGAVAHPLEALEHKLLGKAEDAINMVGSSPFGEMLGAMPGKFVHSMLHWAADHLSPASLLHGAEHLLGFAEGGISDGDLGGTLSGDADTSTAPSGLQVALQALRDHISTMYAWGGYDLNTGVDCSGLVGDEQLLATGQKPDKRVGTTTSLMGGSWPGMIKGANSSDLFVVGVNPDHMVGAILGQPFEARGKGERLRVGADAATPFDQQFVEQWHLDPTLINPPYDPGSSGDPNSDLGGFTNDKAQRYRDAAKRELDEARKHDADAQRYLDQAAAYKADMPEAKRHHLEAQQRYLKDAAKAETRGHADAAQHYRELADGAERAAGKVGGRGQRYLDEAAKARQEAADDRHRAQLDEWKADHVKTGKHHKGDGSESDNGLMTLRQFNEKLADVGTDFEEGLGLPGWVTDPNKSKVLSIGNALTHLHTSGKAPNWSASPFLPGTQVNKDLSDMLPATHDLGGPIWPGLNLVNNRTGGTEEIVNPRLAAPAMAAAPSGPAPSYRAPVIIQNYNAASDSQAEANRLGRTIGQYVRDR